MSKCDDCKYANVKCPIWYPGKHTESCIVYEKDEDNESIDRRGHISVGTRESD